MIQFDTPRTAVYANWLRTKSHLITGYSTDETGATIHTSAELWGDFPPHAAQFTGKTECFAINQMKAFMKEFQKLQEEAEAVPMEQAITEVLQELLAA
jgi:hypothetical protein